MGNEFNVFWFRRDLRLVDNAGLYHALKSDLPVIPIFIFDKNILDKLDNKKDSRVEFIFDTIEEIKKDLKAKDSGMLVYYNTPENAFKELTADYKINTVFTNRDYEPYATERDEAIEKLLKDKNIEFRTFKDHVIFEKDEVVKNDGDPYNVFTPYSRTWLDKLNKFFLKPYPNKKYFKNLSAAHRQKSISLSDMGFESGEVKIPALNIDEELLRDYAKERDFPAQHGTSRLGIHLRFGTLSIRKLAAVAKENSKVFLSELIWRDFYQMILWNYPKVGKGEAFKKAYDKIEWEKDEEGFKAWCEGKTGYPMVDAGMRQLNEIGFMHNRVRMVTASFLAKHLLIDWRLGEAYFAEKLLDYDLAANNGGWQWSSGSGCDSAPYFRIFNPELQLKKFDPDLKYVKHWVPEFETNDYPAPIVEHKFARERCLERYKKALNEDK